MTGDGILALFGAPIAIENAPQRAIQSALAIHRELARFNDQKKREGLSVPIRMRIGIHSGPVVVGTLGNDLRVEFKAVGDTVILASRLEDLAEPGTIYVTEETFKLAEGLFRFEALGAKAIKGKGEPVKIYRVIAPSTRSTRFEVSAERGLTPFLSAGSGSLNFCSTASSGSRLAAARRFLWSPRPGLAKPASCMSFARPSPTRM